VIQELATYAEVKDSGNEWLGRVPEHWNPATLRTLLSPVSYRDRADLPLLSVVREQGVILRDTTEESTNHNQIPNDLSSYKVVAPGQFALNKMKAWQGSFGVSPYAGIVSPAYFVFDIDAVDSGFFHTAIRSRAYVPFFAGASDGVRIGQWDLRPDRMKEIPFIVPPRREQAAIVRFLDHADSRIRRAIRAKHQLIKLLEEQKQAIVHRAVTRGLDFNVRLKPSGVEWLGDVPAHWELVPNRAVMRLRKQVVGSASTTYTLLSLTKRGVIPRDLDNPEGKFPASFDTYQVVQPGDLIFCLFDIDETPRAVGLAESPGMITGAYTRFECDPSVVDWAYLYYQAMDDGKRLRPLYTGLRKVITKTAFLSARMPLPAESERAEILASVARELSASAELAQRAQAEVDLLAEYRARLIADVVTGKVDVREAASLLPDDLPAADAQEFFSASELLNDANLTDVEDSLV